VRADSCCDCWDARHQGAGCAGSPTGFAKFEARYKPCTEFMELLVRTCVAMELKGFNSQDLANIINGEAGWMSVGSRSYAC
jgi:hypothetical protein